MPLIPELVLGISLLLSLEGKHFRAVFVSRSYSLTSLLLNEILNIIKTRNQRNLNKGFFFIKIGAALKLMFGRSL